MPQAAGCVGEHARPGLASGVCLVGEVQTTACVLLSVLDPQGFSDLTVPVNQPGFLFKCRV